MKNSISLKSIFVLVAILLLASATGWAQDARILGTVSDTTGGVIPGVEVTVTNLATGVSRQAVTDDSGHYSVPQLFTGNYRVSASMSGFDAQQLELLLDPGQATEQNFQLSVGVPTTVIEVASSAARINVNPYDVATVIEEKQLEQLPLLGRNVLQLANLAPGVLKGRQGARGNQAEDGVRAGGMAMEHVNILLDGIDNATRVVFGPLAQQSQSAKPPPEAIAEFQVITNNTSAEYGSKAGATILISTRGGTNQFHGTAYDFHRNAAVAANNFMFNRDGPRDSSGELTQDPPPFLRNQYGGTIGGPVIKDKTFFFFSFQGTRQKSGSQSFLRSVPTALERGGDFSQSDCLDQGRCPDIYDPLTNVITGVDPETGLDIIERAQFPNNVIPQNRVDPVAIQLLNLAPLPNTEGQANYFHVGQTLNENEVFDVRIDHNFNDRHRIFGRYSYRTEDASVAGPLPFPARVSNINAFRTKQFALNYNATLTNTIHNEFRGGFSKFNAARTDDWGVMGIDKNAELGILGSASDQHPERAADAFSQTGLSWFILTGYENLGGASGGGTLSGVLDTLTYADNLLWDVGQHSLKFGAEYRRWDNSRSQLFIGNKGRFFFDGRYTSQFPHDPTNRRDTGNAVAQAMLGLVDNAQNQLPAGEDMNIPYWGFYVQDDWRVTPKLTVNIGLRYELYMQPRVNLGGGGLEQAQAIWNGFNTAAGLVLPEEGPLDVSFSEWRLPTSSSDCACELDKNDWAPRFGIAYRIGDNTVIRTGAGLYYSENATAGIESNRFQAGGPIQLANNVDADNFPTEDRFTLAVTTVQQGFALYDIDENPPLDTFTTCGGTCAANPTVPIFKKTINTYQWFLDVQHQLPWDILMTVGYNGVSAHNIPWWQRNFASDGLPGVISAGDISRRRTNPDPAVTNTIRRLNGFVITGDNVLNSNYNAFTFKTEKRFSDGLSFTNSFTWSKGMDYGLASINERTENLVGGGAPHSPYQRDLHHNYATPGLSRDFAYNLSFLYELPAGPGRGHFESGPASWVLGGWQLGAIMQLQSGPYATVVTRPNQANVGGLYRGDLVGNVNFPESQRDSVAWWNQAAIGLGDLGRRGTAGRAIMELPGWKNFDLLLSKYFAMPWEGHRIQFRFEAYNLPNTAHLGNPGNSNGVGQVRADVGNGDRIFRADAPRIIQFALKYTF